MDDTTWMYNDLEEKWRAESCAPFASFADSVYKDHSLLLEFADRATNWRSVCPQRFSDARLDGLTGQWARSAVKWLTGLSSGPVNMTMIGANGAGKTHAAIAACRYVSLHGVLRGDDVLYRPVVGLLECVDAHNELDGWSKSQNAAEMVAFYKNVPLLVLDDLGSIATTSQAAVANVVSIVNHRYNTNKPLVVTSNLDDVELTKLYGTTMVRRIINDETFVAVQPKD
jgi:DNA replication protein DnaC